MNWALVGAILTASVAIIASQAMLLRSWVSSRMDKLEINQEKFIERCEKLNERLTILETEHKDCTCRE